MLARLALTAAVALASAAAKDPKMAPTSSPVVSPPTSAAKGETDPAKIFEPKAVREAVADAKEHALAVLNVTSAFLPRQTKEAGSGFTYRLALDQIRTLTGPTLPVSLEVYKTLPAMPSHGRHAAVFTKGDGGWHLARLIPVADEVSDEALTRAALAAEARREAK
ncbi:MAG TPA: hypothetical protein VGK67_34405 [Myxococcales bacterium]